MSTGKIESGVGGGQHSGSLIWLPYPVTVAPSNIDPMLGEQ